MAWLDDIVTALQAAGVGTLNADIFVSSRAVVPVLASGFATISIKSTPGTSPENTHNSTTRPAYLQPGAQILVRADDWEEAETKALAAYSALYQVQNEFINSGWYKWIRPTQEPFDMGLDARGQQQQVAFNVIGNYNKR